MDELEAGDIDVDEPQACYGSAEGRLLPQDLEAWRKSLKIIDIPAVRPGEQDEKDAHFQRKQRQRKAQQAPLPPQLGPGITLNGSLWLRFRIRVGEPALWFR